MLQNTKSASRRAGAKVLPIDHSQQHTGTGGDLVHHMRKYDTYSCRDANVKMHKRSGAQMSLAVFNFVNVLEDKIANSNRQRKYNLSATPRVAQVAWFIPKFCSYSVVAARISEVLCHSRDFAHYFSGDIN